jgi:hypothetical protein
MTLFSSPPESAKQQIPLREMPPENQQRLHPLFHSAA